MAVAYSRGTPDRYYEGNSGCIWVEYKFLRILPAKLIKVHDKVTPKQQLWLNRAHDNGVNVAVIVGHENGGMFITNPDIWNGDTVLCRETFLTLSVPRKQLAQIITSVVAKESR